TGSTWLVPSRSLANVCPSAGPRPAGISSVTCRPSSVTYAPARIARCSVFGSKVIGKLPRIGDGWVLSSVCVTARPVPHGRHAIPPVIGRVEEPPGQHLIQLVLQPASMPQALGVATGGKGPDGASVGAANIADPRSPRGAQSCDPVHVGTVGRGEHDLQSLRHTLTRLTHQIAQPHSGGVLIAVDGLRRLPFSGKPVIHLAEVLIRTGVVGSIQVRAGAHPQQQHDEPQGRWIGNTHPVCGG